MLQEALALQEGDGVGNDTLEGVRGADDRVVGLGDVTDGAGEGGDARDDGDDAGEGDDALLAVRPDLVEEAAGVDGAGRVEGAVGGGLLDAAQDGAAVGGGVARVGGVVVGGVGDAGTGDRDGGGGAQGEQALLDGREGPSQVDDVS